MSKDITRRGVLAGALAAGIGGLTLTGARTLLEQFAPLSGSVWEAANRQRAETVESPHGDAAVRYDGDGVPTVEADDEQAAYFAVGYTQAFDRLFQMDIQRRVMRGQVSELAGEATLEDDEFHVRMDFLGAAEATWNHVADTPAGPLIEAYADGVNAAIDGETPPLEFHLLGYQPRPWTPVDTLLMEKQIAWTLTGDFSELRRALLADRLGEDAAAELHPDRMEHDVPILRDSGGDEQQGDEPQDDEQRGNQTQSDERPDDDGQESLGGELTEWLSRFESPTGVGSNSWVVSGEHTESGQPIVAYDPHLSLMAPPLWYEQHVETPETSVRGATFPGVPFVITGANGRGTWSFTNVGADVLDCYTYDIRESGGEPEAYRYQGEYREFDTETRTIPVSDSDDRTVTVRKTVHGPLLEREGRTVAVAWTGHTATRTTEAIYEFERSDGLEDILEATRKFDVPTQNLVYADADGRTLYYATGKLPIRTVDGDTVSENQIFDGSIGEGEWEGFTPFGDSSWSGFVPFEEKPHAIDPDVLATANQRVADDPEHYIGVSYAMPYRGARIYDRLEERLAAGPTDREFHRRLQTDVYDGRASTLVPDIVSAVRDGPEVTDDILEAANALDEWDYRMDRESYPALVFARWIAAFRTEVLEPTFGDADLDESYYPNDWVLTSLPPESRWFEERSRPAAMVRALEAALEEIDDAGWERYGDWNTTGVVGHPFGGEAPFLNYDTRAADGSLATVKNYRVDSAVGASWRMVVEPGEGASAILPGGNSGDYFSPHYDDQFERWLNGEQKPMDRTVEGNVDIDVRGEGS